MYSSYRTTYGIVIGIAPFRDVYDNTCVIRATADMPNYYHLTCLGGRDATSIGHETRSGPSTDVILEDHAR